MNKKSSSAHRRSGFARMWHDHSLSIVAGSILTAWLLLYAVSDPKTHLGAFYGNAIADWSGSVIVILGTKYFVERGSPESKKARPYSGGALGVLQEHSLSIFVFLSGLLWVIAYIHMDPTAKWGQVVGNIVSEWLQIFGLIFLTKSLYEVKSKASKERGRGSD